MLPVVWLDSAIADLTAIITFIAEENPAKANLLRWGKTAQISRAFRCIESIPG